MRTGKRTRAALSSWQEKLEFGVAEKTAAGGTANHEICRGQAVSGGLQAPNDDR